MQPGEKVLEHGRDYYPISPTIDTEARERRARAPEIRLKAKERKIEAAARNIKRIFGKSREML